MRRTIILFALILSKQIFAEDGAEWKALFDGKSLEGWVDGAGEAVSGGWKAGDGVLHRHARGGDIYTAEDYGDFELRFEWKVAEGANSGVKYRVARFGKSWLGPEYQVLDDDGHGNGKVAKTSAASMYALFPPADGKKLKPVGEWNSARIVVRDGVFQHWVNGMKVVEVDTAGEAWKQAVAASKFRNVEGFGVNARGRIMLQDHGDEVWFREIRLRPLSS